MFKAFKDWFWTDSFWLPYGFKWSDVEKEAPLSNLYIAPFVTIAILLLRHIFERYFAINLCIYIGIRGSKPDVNSSDTELSISSSEKQTWFRSRRQQQLALQFQKATETCWRCFAYFLLFIYGAYVIFSSDWFWDQGHWLEGYIKNQPFTDELKWYYIVELSFYMALMTTQFSDTKRKDFLQQFIHHIATIILISGSYLIAQNLIVF